MSRVIYCFVASGFVLSAAVASVPEEINHQGKVSVNSQPFSGTGLFRFAIVDPDTGISSWTNDGTNVGVFGGVPSTPVSVEVLDGLYEVRLGNTDLPDMFPVSHSIFEDDNLILRVWFDDGVNGLQQLLPDHKLTSAPYAFRAGVTDELRALGAAGPAVTVDDSGDTAFTGVFNGANGVFVHLEAKNATGAPPDGSTGWVDVLVASGLDIPAGPTIVNWAVESWSGGGTIDFRMVVGDAPSTHTSYRPFTAWAPDYSNGTGGMLPLGGTTIKLQARRGGPDGGFAWSIGGVRWSVIVFRE